MSPVMWTAIGIGGIALVFALAVLLAPDLFRRERDWTAGLPNAPVDHTAQVQMDRQRAQDQHRHLSTEERQP